MAKVVKISEENYKKLNAMAGSLRAELGVPVSMDYVISRILSDINKESVAIMVSKAIKHRKEIAACYIFGSAAKGIKANDIDIGLLLKRSFVPEAFYEGEIATELEKAGLRNVDVRILNNAPVRFLNQVLKYGKLVFSNDESARMEFEAYVIKRYIDMAPHHAEYDIARMKRLVA